MRARIIRFTGRRGGRNRGARTSGAFQPGRLSKS